MNERASIGLVDFLRKQAEVNSRQAINLLEEAPEYTIDPTEATRKANQAMDLLSGLAGIGSSIEFVKHEEERVREQLSNFGIQLPGGAEINFSILLNEDDLPETPPLQLENLSGKKVYSLFRDNFPDRGRGDYTDAEHQEARHMLEQLSEKLPPNVSLASIHIAKVRGFPLESFWRQSVRAITLRDYLNDNCFQTNVYPIQIVKGDFDQIITVEDEIPIENGIEKGLVLPKDTYNMLIEDLDLGARAYRCLRRNGIAVLGGILSSSREELLGIRNFGKKSFDVTISKLKEQGYISGSQN